jgi:hypothetical protein
MLWTEVDRAGGYVMMFFFRIGRYLSSGIDTDTSDNTDAALSYNTSQSSKVEEQW